MNKRMVLIMALIFGLGIVLSSCVGLQVKPTAANFKEPVITLESFEVPQYDEWWYYSSKVKPTSGKAGNHGAPLIMSFVFNIQNPNPFPVLLEGINFTIAFDKEFDVITSNNQDTNWIPANKTDQVRITTMIMPRTALLSVLVTGGFKLKAKGWKAMPTLERWWKGVPELSVPVTIKECSFVFKADGVLKVLPFEATAH